jgi:extracellular solute-binding protein
MTRCTVIAIAVLTALTLSACGSEKKASTTTTSPNGVTTISVAVPPQLKTLAAQLGKVYESAHKPSKVIVHGLSGPALVAAAKGKGPLVALDTTASLRAANPKLALHDLGRDIAVVAVPSTNPAKVADLAVFKAGSSARTRICVANSSFGNFGVLLLRHAGITPEMATVRGDCRKEAMLEVAAKKLDAVLMYRAETVPPRGVKLLPVARAQNFPFSFSYATVGSSPGVSSFAAFLASGSGRFALGLAGYLP